MTKETADNLNRKLSEYYNIEHEKRAIENELETLCSSGLERINHANFDWIFDDDLKEELFSTMKNLAEEQIRRLSERMMDI